MGMCKPTKALQKKKEMHLNQMGKKNSVSS